MEALDEIDQLVLKKLEEGKEPISTYKLAKITNISWSTINIHCYKLEAMGKIKSRLETKQIGSRKKRVWNLVK
ncbi:MAG: HTH domain-containing protein [Candidatus Aenigmarchaeota archaeon]|nr:HTH domain-containing protein [Candidatus Aenigmarchaeota archaeon]MCK5321961.1 HTH domain-containing protein [Candidatus Aenigmarchaeota archaeon]